MLSCLCGSESFSVSHVVELRRPLQQLCALCTRGLPAVLQAAGIMRTTPLSLPSKGYSFATWLRLEGGAAKGTSSLFSLLLRGAELKGVAAAFTGGHRTQHVRLTHVLCCAPLLWWWMRWQRAALLGGQALHVVHHFVSRLPPRYALLWPPSYPVVLFLAAPVTFSSGSVQGV